MQEKLLTILGWVGSVLGIMGAVILSLNIDVSGWGYVLFLVSSVSLSIWSLVSKQTHQLTMHAAFTLINANGCINWLL